MTIKPLQNRLILGYYNFKANLALGWHSTTPKLKPNNESPNPEKNRAWEKLKKTTFHAAKNNDHENYESIISEYDSKLTLITDEQACTQKRFVGEGIGQNTLNTYRKIQLIDGRELFEKVYLMDSRDYEHFKWASDQVLPRLDPNKIRTPKPLFILCGEKLAVVYFEFITAKLNNYRNFIKPVINTTNYLSTIEPSDVPKSMTDFKSDPHFKNCFQTTITILKQHCLENELDKFLKLTKVVAESTKVPTHGDLHGKNLGKPNYVIDWDRAGFYPVGYDIALSLSKTQNITSIRQLNLLSDTLNKNQAQHTLEKNLLFFCTVFYSCRINKKITLDTWLEIIEHTIKN